MKRLYPILVLSFTGLVVSCGTDQQQGGAASPLATANTPRTAVIPPSKTLCFQQVSGDRNQDTLNVQLHFNGDQVTGYMNRIPDGKDARSGRLSGLLLQPDIKMVWTYTQEGIQDSVQVDFRLGNNELWQRPLRYSAATGREQTDTGAGYTVRIPLVDCR